MNFRKLSAFLGSAVLLGLLTTSTGCIVVGSGGGRGGGRGGGGGGGGRGGPRAGLTPALPARTGIPTQSCTDTGISQVSSAIDNGTAVTVPGANGSGASAQQTGHLAPGSHPIAVTAYDSQSCGLYGVTATFTTFAGNEV